MSWTVIAAFAAPAVAAVLGAWGIAREQSVIRRLERITAILKDTPKGAAAEAHLQWLRDDLARRLNIAYRAPRERESQWFGWALTVLGGSILAGIYILIVVAAAIASNTSEEPISAGQGVLTFVLIVVGAIASLLFGFGLIIRRNKKRERWAEEAAADDTHSPKI